MKWLADRLVEFLYQDARDAIDPTRPEDTARSR